MKTRLLFLFLFLGTQAVQAQTALLQRKGELLQRLVAQKHIQPRAVDDAFSQDLFQLFVTTLDADALYFTKQDMQALQPFRNALDDEWNGGPWRFPETVSKRYRQKLQQTDSLVKALLLKPFDFSAAEAYTADTAWSADDKARAARWSRRLKFEALKHLLNTHTASSAAPLPKETVLKRESDVRRKLQARYQTHFKTVLEAEPHFGNTVGTVYLDAYLRCMDAHSNYFDAAGKRNFESGLNEKGYYFGFTLEDTEEGAVAIAHLEPGGPAWRSGMLNKGDVFLKLKWEGREPVDLEGLTAGEVSLLLDESNTEGLLLHVRKQNAVVDSVYLHEETLSNDDNIVKSFVLKGDKTIGYVMLPGFYAEWEDAEGSRCANDVAKAIVKLKQDGMAGLVLDLRFNGGGSLQEAVEMAGIFIDDGIVCQIKTGEGLQSLKDMNRGVIWNGPLLVLVNGQSASASELLAACLQDYNRAVIAGTPTYGKATGQEMMPVPANTGAAVVNSEEGAYLKLTVLRLYRSSGKAVQKSGVQPHILLPDAYQRFAPRESDNPHALPADTVAAYKYFKPLKPLPVAALQQASAARVGSNEKFQMLQSAAVQAGGASGPFSLKWDDAVRHYAAAAGERNHLKQALLQPTTLYTPAYTGSDAALLKTGLGRADERWLRRLAGDPYIEEAFLIVRDLINLNP